MECVAEGVIETKVSSGGTARPRRFIDDCIGFFVTKIDENAREKSRFWESKNLQPASHCPPYQHVGALRELLHGLSGRPAIPIHVHELVLKSAPGVGM